MNSIKDAEAVAGSLSKPSKMPGYAYGIPAKNCNIGSKLVKIPNSVCSKCYALKGRYVFPNVKAAQERRLQSLTHPDWVDALVLMIQKTKTEYFRWHDSGDIQGVWHLNNIVKIANLCPDVKFWLPTREKGYVSQWLLLNKTFPNNLVVRVSGAMIDGAPPKGFANTSTVVSQTASIQGPHKNPGNGLCQAPLQGGQCASCRRCWEPEVGNVAYTKH